MVGAVIRLNKAPSAKWYLVNSLYTTFPPNSGWITSLPIVIFDQSQPSLPESRRLGCDWSILSLVYPTWWMKVDVNSNRSANGFSVLL